MRAFAQLTTIGAMALVLSITVGPALADTDPVEPLAVPTDIAELRSQPAQGYTLVPLRAGEQPLSSALLANYVERQQTLRAFDHFDPEPMVELTEDVLLGYIARGSFGTTPNQALRAIESFAAAPTVRSPLESTRELNENALATYVRNGYEPTAARLETALKERECLAQAIYHEARGETQEGQMAVANVIVNRAQSSRYPSTLCGVIYQNAHLGRYRCQFTFACDGRSDVPGERRAWERSVALAAEVWSAYAQDRDIGVVPSDTLYYHTTAVSPSWSRVFNRVAQIGTHVFYVP